MQRMVPRLAVGAFREVRSAHARSGGGRLSPEVCFSTAHVLTAGRGDDRQAAERGCDASRTDAGNCHSGNGESYDAQRDTVVIADCLSAASIAASRAAEWFRQLPAGLQVAHSMGIVHRDLKPENVMIVANPGDGRGDLVEIMDFGLAKSADAATGVTEFVSAGTPIGTIDCMAPEMLTGDTVDERADLFAGWRDAGRNLTGARPFQGGTIERMLAQVSEGDYQLPVDSPETQTRPQWEPPASEATGDMMTKPADGRTRLDPYEVIAPSGATMS
jgi:serine/threonine protein kinase